MLSRTGRPLAQVVFGPIARLFVKAGISANTVTVVGTVLSCASALFFFPQDMLLLGALVTAILVVFDNLDGQIARLTGTSSKWGAFLDSTMDRFSDGIIFASLALWAYLHADPAVAVWGWSGAIAAMLFGSIVPYARARAEGVGYKADVGFAERADRLVFTLVIILLVGFELGDWIFAVGMWLLALAAFVTVIQRMVYVYKQMVADANQPTLEEATLEEPTHGEPTLEAPNGPDATESEDA